MVNRYQPKAGMASASDGDYVEFTAYGELAAQYQSLFETAEFYLDMVARGDITAHEAKTTLLAVRRLGGF